MFVGRNKNSFCKIADKKWKDASQSYMQTLFWIWKSRHWNHLDVLVRDETLAKHFFNSVSQRVGPALLRPMSQSLPDGEIYTFTVIKSYKTCSVQLQTIYSIINFILSRSLYSSLSGNPTFPSSGSTSLTPHTQPHNYLSWYNCGKKFTNLRSYYTFYIEFYNSPKDLLETQDRHFYSTESFKDTRLGHVTSMYGTH